MKLQSQVSRIYKEKEYIKYWVVIPREIIRELEWENLKNLNFELKDKKLILSAK